MASDTSKFNSISPSALALLEARSFTTIPFARESYSFVSQRKSDQKLNPPQASVEDSTLAKFDFGLKTGGKLPKEVISRIMHFEARYRSIDQGLRQLGSTRIIEFSSGLSLRGLDFCRNPEIQYLDTDLPEVIDTKRALVAEVNREYCDYQPDNLILKGMNAMNREEFFENLKLFDTGPISIVNEGLLMYLDEHQKEELAKIIHEVLQKYGGYWITTDIYRRDDAERREINKYYNQRDKDFVSKHNIDANKFASFEEA